FGAPGNESTHPAYPTQKSVAELRPLAPERYKVQFTVSRETHQKLRETQDLLRHRIPDGDIAAIFERALTLLLAELHKTQHPAADRPRQTSPAAQGDMSRRRSSAPSGSG